MAQILHIAREHGQDLSWWDGLSRGHQIMYLADSRERHAADMRARKKAEARAAAAARRRR